MCCTRTRLTCSRRSARHSNYTRFGVRNAAYDPLDSGNARQGFGSLAPPLHHTLMRHAHICITGCAPIRALRLPFCGHPPRLLRARALRRSAMQTFVGNGCGLFTILRWLLGLQRDRIKDPAPTRARAHDDSARACHSLHTRTPPSHRQPRRLTTSRRLTLRAPDLVVHFLLVETSQ